MGRRLVRSILALGGSAVAALATAAGATAAGATAAHPVSAATRAAAARPTAVHVLCPAGTAAGARCGTVQVPLDRAHPHGAQIKIAFQFYPATDRAQRPISTIVASNGGPGASNIASAPLWLSLLAPALTRHNFLAIDHRGIGASQAIDCPALQHVQGDQIAAARACGAQLGDAAYRYGSGDVAQDVEAVREALRSTSSTTTACPTARSTSAPTPTATRSTCGRRSSTRRTTRRIRRSSARCRPR